VEHRPQLSTVVAVVSNKRERYHSRNNLPGSKKLSMGSSFSSSRKQRRLIRTTLNTKLTTPSLCTGRFQPFLELGDDIVLSIISFVSVGPFENEEEGTVSFLTHVLPCVSLQFREVCRSDLLWMDSLNRFISSDPNGFKDILKIMIKAEFKRPTWSVYYNEENDKNYFMLAAEIQKMEVMKIKERLKLISKIYRSIYKCGNDDSKQNEKTHSERSFMIDYNGDSHRVNNVREMSVQVMYFSVMKEYVKVTFPIFHMRYQHMRIGTSVTITLFEPRYRLLLREIMKGRKRSEYRGKILSVPRPAFIFVCSESMLGSESDAFLVEICRCQMLDGGRANVMITPVEKIKLISFNERNDIGNGLCDGYIKRYRT